MEIKIDFYKLLITLVENNVGFSVKDGELRVEGVLCYNATTGKPAASDEIETITLTDVEVVSLCTALTPQTSHVAHILHSSTCPLTTEITA